MELFEQLLFALWFFLPAGIANMVPIFAAFTPGIKQYDFPMDFGRHFRGRRIFGPHKTIRGLVVGIIFATLVLWLQKIAVGNFSVLAAFTAQIDYSALPVLIVGPLFGLGALLGDAAESFFKRQIGIKPGERWFPFDQIDYIIGGAIAVLPFMILSPLQYIMILLMWLVIHLASSYVGFRMGVKTSPI